ncbi:MAG TPA: TonB-dependent receptor [Rhizomicrobium sp.]|nr:TonB-dependent receptor [Rhizomicrobium sp.]
MRASRLSILCLSSLLLNASLVKAAGDTENIVVTATRTPEPAEKTGESISVLTSDQLTMQQIVNVADALQQIPGAVVVRNGGLGQNATISLRGAEAGQTLVLIDGIRINDPSTVDNEALLGDLLTNGIDRIEVLRGPQSTLYGSDAIGGVVDILTRRGGGGPFALRASAQGGSFDSYNVNVGAQGTVSSVEYGASADFLHTSGVSAADSRNGNPETDGYGNAGLAGNIRWHISDVVSVDLRSYYTNARDDFDDNFVFVPPAMFRVADSRAYGRNALLAGYAGLNLDLLQGAFSSRFGIAASESQRAFYDSALDTVHKNASDAGTDWRLEYQGILQLRPEDQLTFGAEYQRIAFTGKSFSSFAPTEIDDGRSHVASGYAQNMLTLFDRLTLTAGFRHDEDAEFGGHNSVKLAAALPLNEYGTVLRANYGDGFKAPTLYEQFSAYSNPLHPLMPEVAHGWEAGFDQRLLDGTVLLQATYFQRHTDNQIDFFTPNCFTDPPPDVCKTRPFGYYDNIARTRADGVELDATATLFQQLTVNAALTEMTATDARSGLDLARRPRLAGSGTVTWTPDPDWSVGGTVIYIGRRFDSAGEQNPLTAYATLNVFASRRITESLELYARIENALDAHYEPVFGYGAPGRAAYGGVRLTY